MNLSPYPTGARVRVGEQFGSIVTVGSAEDGAPLARPFYHVQFDDRSGGENRIVLHEDIQACYADGLPYLIVLVDHETFARFENDDNHVFFQDVGAKKDGRIPPTRGNVIFWRDCCWISTGGAWISDDAGIWPQDDAFTLSYVSVELVVPRTEWQGEIREPHYTHRSNLGYVVIAPDGEYVCTGITAHLAPLPEPHTESKTVATETQIKLL